MTHGPKPKKAIDEAVKIAAGRGTVINTSVMQGFFIDLMLFTGTQTVFIRVGRIRTHACDPQDIAWQFKELIRLLRHVPLSPVVCREIHILAPWGAWQYFRIDDYQILEIRSNGALLIPEVSGSCKKNGGTGPDPEGSADKKVTGIIPLPGVPATLLPET